MKRKTKKKKQRKDVTGLILSRFEPNKPNTYNNTAAAAAAAPVELLSSMMGDRVTCI